MCGSTFYLSAKCCWLTTVIRSDFRLMGISMFTSLGPTALHFYNTLARESEQWDGLMTY